MHCENVATHVFISEKKYLCVNTLNINDIPTITKVNTCWRPKKAQPNPEGKGEAEKAMPNPEGKGEAEKSTAEPRGYG